MIVTPTITSRLTKLLLVLCIAIYVGHFWIIFKNAVNVPWWDEWGILSPDALPAGFTVRWIIEQANEHRIVPTKLLAWALFYTSGHNYNLSKAATYAIYGLILVCIVLFARRMVPHMPLWGTLAFIIFLLSPINYEINFGGFGTAFHFGVLFTLLAAYFLFNEPQTGSRLALGAFMAVLATYSTFGALVAVCILIVLFTLFKVIRAVRSSGSERRMEYVQLIAVVTPVLTLIAVYFVDYHTVPYHPPVAFPYEASFWRFFTNVVSWGFGFETHSVLLGTLCLLLVLAPIALEIWRQRSQLPASSWAVYAFTLAILGILATISGARANFNEGSKSSRYADFAMMLVPFTALAWAIALRHRPNLKKYVLAGLWVFCCLGFSYKWLWFSVYRVQRDSLNQGVGCIKTYYKEGGQAMCPTLYAAPLGSMLDEAKRLNLSFYREIQREL